MDTISIVITVIVLFAMIYFSTFFYSLYSKLLKTLFIFSVVLIIIWALITYWFVPRMTDGILKILFVIIGMGFLFAGILCGGLTINILILYIISSVIISLKG